jgi:hypothetical protein
MVSSSNKIVRRIAQVIKVASYFAQGERSQSPIIQFGSVFVGDTATNKATMDLAVDYMWKEGYSQFLNAQTHQIVMVVMAVLCTLMALYKVRQ